VQPQRNFAGVAGGHGQFPSNAAEDTVRRVFKNRVDGPDFRLTFSAGSGSLELQELAL